MPNQARITSLLAASIFLAVDARSANHPIILQVRRGALARADERLGAGREWSRPHGTRATFPISAWVPADSHQEPPLHDALIEVELQ